MSVKRVGVAFGGVSAEHDISVATATNVCKNIPRSDYSVSPIYITKTGKYVFGSEEKKPENILSETPLDISESINKFRNFDVIFNALHGPFGEDGSFQAFLHTLGIPNTGSPMSSSSLAMDKMRARMVMRAGGIPVPDSVYLTSSTDEIPFLPAVIKPNQNGSSYGITIVREKKDLLSAIKTAFQFDKIVIAEELLTGKEITCAIVDRGGENIQALPVTLIEPQVGEFFDLKSKYERGGSIETTPAPISDESTKYAQKLALQTHQLIGCKGITRTDMFLDKKGNIKVIEINTLPGMTDTSLVPQAAKIIGITFPDLLSIIVEEAMSR